MNGTQEAPETQERLLAELERRYLRRHVLVRPWLAIVIPVIMVALPFLASELTANRVRVYYDKQLEDYRRQLDMRDRAARVAEYVAMWHASGEVNDVDSMEKLEFYRRLNQLSFELALFLPADVYKQLGPALAKAPSGKTAGDILVDVRKHLLSDPGDLTAENIIYHWPHLKTLVEQKGAQREAVAK